MQSIRTKSHSRLMRKNLILLLLMPLLFSGCSTQENRDEVLRVYNWTDYISEDVLNNFPEWYYQQTGQTIRVEYNTFDINEEMLSEIENDHADYDAVCPSEYIIERMLRKDLLLPIDTAFGHTPNYLQNVSPYTVKMLDNVSNSGRMAHDYAVPYMWGTCGILYNKKYVPQRDAQTWYALWNPAYRGEILMLDSYRDCYGAALIYANRYNLMDSTLRLSNLLNDCSPKAIGTAEKMLNTLKGNVKGWVADLNETVFARHLGWINMVWSGDATWCMNLAAPKGIQLGYEVPQEGSNVWIDGWVIPKYAKNPKAASYFINYLCQGYVAIQTMKSCKYVSCVGSKMVLKKMTDENAFSKPRDLSYFFGNEGKEAHLDTIMYPDSSVVARCALIHDTGKKSDKVLKMWQRIIKNTNRIQEKSSDVVKRGKKRHDGFWHAESNLFE